jgi:prevent-host-death family protein
MDIVDIHEAKTHLFRLIEKAARGEAFVIAKAGKPMVKVLPVDTNHTEQKRIGFLLGQFEVPHDCNRMGDREIDRFFGERE